MNDQVLSALREIREVHAEDFGELARRLLELLSKAMASVRVTLSLPQATEELIFGEGDERLLGPDAARLTVRIPCRSGVAVLGVVRASPFNARDDATRAELELLGGDIVLRLDHARSEREARRLGRQIELLHALSRAGTDAQRFPELADRAAQELLGAFAGAHVLVHVKVDDVLELIARRIENGTGSAMATAPEWIVRLPLDAQSVMAIAARENRVVSRPVSEIPEPRRGVLEGFGVHHLLSVPLFFRDEVLGTISVAHREEMPWDQESIRMLEGAAAQLSIELVNIRALEAERHRAEDLGLINELGSLVAQHIELPAVLATAVNELARITKVSRVHMFLADEAKTVLNAVACSEEREANLVFPLTASAAVVHAYHAREPIIVDNAAIDPRTDKDLVRRLHTRSIMAVPLIARGEPIGSIGLVETQRARTFTKTEVARAVAVANIVSTAVTNAKMFDDLRRSYEALAHAQAELVMHERLAALGELSAVIAHEVRNPLAIIFNSLGALRRIDPLTSDAKLLLDIVGEEAARRESYRW